MVRLRVQRNTKTHKPAAAKGKYLFGLVESAKICRASAFRDSEKKSSCTRPVVRGFTPGRDDKFEGLDLALHSTYISTGN